MGETVNLTVENTSEQQLEVLRRKIRGIESAGSGPTAAEVHTRTPVAVPVWMTSLLQEGGLPRGAAAQVADCPALLVHLLAAVTAQGGCAAVVNHPQLAVAAVEAAGGDIDRLVLVPDSHPHTAAVLATLVEGMDMVIYHPLTGQSEVTPTFARSVDARLKKSECSLVVCGGTWPSSRLSIDAEVSGVMGLGQGSGRVRAIELNGRVWGKAQPPRTFTVEIGERWDSEQWMDGLAPGVTNSPSWKQAVQ